MDVRFENQKIANEMKKILVGKRFRHFKGNVYKVLNVGVDSETTSCVVIYCSESDESLVWVRPLEMFTSDVDKVKYPNVTQKLRFEELPDVPELDKRLYKDRAPYNNESIEVG